jgi:hypothetical protein
MTRPGYPFAECYGRSAPECRAQSTVHGAIIDMTASGDSVIIGGVLLRGFKVCGTLRKAKAVSMLRANGRPERRKHATRKKTRRKGREYT